MKVSYTFFNNGQILSPEKDSIALDVGMKTVPGVIDHHHPEATDECTASLIVKNPDLVLDHLEIKKNESTKINFKTHNFPDLDVVSSIFLTFKLLELGKVNASMKKIAHYVRIIDSASLPKDIDLTSTTESILRALFSEIRNKSIEETNRARIKEGLELMDYLYSRSEEGHEILRNKYLFSGNYKYERAMRTIENDYLNYLTDLKRSKIISLMLPLDSENIKKEVDALIIKNPTSFLLKEWAWRDRENSPLNNGFGFIMCNFRKRRFSLGVDPEVGVNLRGLGDLLNKKEKKKREKNDISFPFFWYQGNCPFFNYRIIVTPQGETILTQQEIIEELLYFSNQNTKK